MAMVTVSYHSTKHDRYAHHRAKIYSHFDPKWAEKNDLNYCRYISNLKEYSVKNGRGFSVLLSHPRQNSGCRSIGPDEQRDERQRRRSFMKENQDAKAPSYRNCAHVHI